MLHHYVPEVSVNAVRPAPRKPKVRARKRNMDSHSFTFEILKSFMETRLRDSTNQPSGSSANIMSALNGFLAERGYRETDSVGSILRSSYKDNVKAHAEALRAQGRPPQYIANRKSLLAHWRRAITEADRASAARIGRASPFQAAVRDLFARGATMKGTARTTGVPLATIKRWLEGAVPNAKSAKWVPRLERHFGVPEGTLSDLLPFRLGRELAASPQPEIAYRRRLRKQVSESYAIKEPNERLRSEWQHLVAYKVMSAKDVRRLGLQRSRRGKWRMTAAPVKVAQARNWYSFHESNYVASADMLWSFVSQYLGWLQLPVREVSEMSEGASDAEAGLGGGMGFTPAEAMTLANFVRSDLLDRFVEWRKARSGGHFHQGIVRFLKAASSLCHPTTGYLTQSYKRFSDVVPNLTPEDWAAACRNVHADVADIIADESDRAEPVSSRDSFEPIAHVLAMPNPLDAVADAVIRLDADRPSTGGIDEAVWARNRLLLKLLASNPLRDKNVRMLTFTPDGKGHLRKVNGEWRIAIPKREFKNFEGAAKERDYDMVVRPEVWPDIERYLGVYRPMLAPSGNPYVFVSSRDNSGPMKKLRKCFAALTRKYLTRCPGVGPHAMRHLVATAILKQKPNDWMAAAYALHDRPETVMTHYGHLKSDDAYQWFAEAMAGPFSRM